jgi:hypothetical protein
VLESSRETKTPPDGRRQRTRRTRALTNNDDRNSGRGNESVHRPLVNRFDPPPSTPGRIGVWIACGKPCEPEVNTSGSGVDDREIRWITLWAEKSPLTCGNVCSRVSPLRRHDTGRPPQEPVRRLLLGTTGETGALGEDISVPRSGGEAQRFEAEMATRPPGATPTGEPSERIKGNNPNSFTGGCPRPGNPGWSAGRLAAPPGVLLHAGEVRHCASPRRETAHR